MEACPFPLLSEEEDLLTVEGPRCFWVTLFLLGPVVGPTCPLIFFFKEERGGLGLGLRYCLSCLLSKSNPSLSFSLSLSLLYNVHKVWIEREFKKIKSAFFFVSFSFLNFLRMFLSFCFVFQWMDTFTHYHYCNCHANNTVLLFGIYQPKKKTKQKNTTKIKRYSFYEPHLVFVLVSRVAMTVRFCTLIHGHGGKMVSKREYWL